MQNSNIWRKFLISIAVLFSNSLGALDITFNKGAIEAMLLDLDMRAPASIHLASIRPEQITSETLPPIVHQLLAEVNAVIPGGPRFKVGTCKSCLAMANLKDFEVFLQPSFIESLRKQSVSQEKFEMSLSFIIAHEVSHYLYEAGLNYSQLSANGNKSFKRLLSEGYHCNIERQRAHFEVDAIAVVLMERMGIANAAEFAKDLIKAQKFSCDGKFRVDALEALAQAKDFAQVSMK